MDAGVGSFLDGACMWFSRGVYLQSVSKSSKHGRWLVWFGLGWILDNSSLVPFVVENSWDWSKSIKGIWGKEN